MLTRMNKYNNKDTKKRTEKNQDLYEKLYEEPDYSNIKAVVDIQKTNEIDLLKIKEMLEEQKQPQRKKKYDMNYDIPESPEESRNYDLSEMLKSAKDSRVKDEDEEIRNLDFAKYRNEIKREKYFSEDYENDELRKRVREMLDKTTDYANMSDKTLSEDLLSELTETKSIEKTLDDSFYTTGMDLKKDDYEKSDFAELEKETSIVTKIIFGILLIISISLLIYALYRFL